MKPMSAARSEISMNWELAGPSNIEGRITAIAIHPTNPSIVYIGAANGGVWKSTNFCATWISLFDNQNTSSVGSLAIDPVNPDIIYVGTGEANSLRSYYPGTGVFKSTNAGTTWFNIGLTESYSIGQIAVNPMNPQELYVAAVGSLRKPTPQRGVYKSTDGGATWAQSLFIADSVGAIDVLLDPVNPTRVYAAMWDRMRREDFNRYGGVNSALYLSTNSGGNWSVLSNGFPSNQSTLGRTSLSVCKSHPNILYALIGLTSGYTGGLYKSTNRGNNWFVVNPTVGTSSSYSWFNRICMVHPVDSNYIFCGGLYFQYSHDGGITFPGYAYDHVDQHAIAFAPSNPDFIIIGNDGGIESSTDGGNTWTSSMSLPITQFYAGEINHHNPSQILGGTQDNGTVMTQTGALNDWADIYGGDGFYCLIDYINPLRFYAASQYGGLGYSTDGGIWFEDGTSGLDLTYSNWMTPYVMDKHNPLKLYCGTYKIHKTINGMASWAPISPDLAKGHSVYLGTITTVDVAKSDTNVIYTGTDDGNVWVTTNGGTNWTLINAGLPNRWVTRVTIHPDSANVCYLTLSGYKIDEPGSHIYRTDNFGTQWKSIRGNLPDAPVNDVIIDPMNYNRLYIATDVGIMYTSNLGQEWLILGNNFPTNVACHDLTLHESTRKLVVWTHGRSAYALTLPIIGIPENTKPHVFILYQNYPNPFNPSTVISYQLTVSSMVKLKIYNVLGQEVRTLVNERQSAGFKKMMWDGNDKSGRAVSSGIYICNIQAGSLYQTKKMTLIR
jgi:photosystem II stability/assembly factor-like uncharacterized protein